MGLARASGPHSGDRQFYVNVADNADLDPLPTRWGYAVFGRVIEGMEVVDRISVSPTGAMGPFKQEAPMQAVVIQKIELLTDGVMPAATRSGGRPADTPAAARPAPQRAPATTSSGHASGETRGRTGERSPPPK